MREVNPFIVFCPPNAKYFILGSFAAKDGNKDWNYDWYYSNGRSQFWRILETIYNQELRERALQQELFTKLAIAVANIILSCERLGISSLDVKLITLPSPSPRYAQLTLEEKVNKYVEVFPALTKL